MCGVIISTTAQAVTCVAGSTRWMRKGSANLLWLGSHRPSRTLCSTQPGSACVTFPLLRRNCCDQSAFERVQVGLDRSRTDIKCCRHEEQELKIKLGGVGKVKI